MVARGFFDKPVGIVYALDKSKQENEDLWVTNEEFTYFIGPVQDRKYVTVPAGFITDGASVPRMFWPIFPPWGVYGQATILHDYLCVNKQLTKNGDDTNLRIGQEEIDKVLYGAMKALGTPVWKRAIIYAAVRFYNTFIA